MDMNSKFQKWYYDANNSCSLTIAADGATTIATIDSDGAVGHLTLAPDGDINLTAAADVNIPSNIGLTFGSATEKIEGSGSDLVITSGRYLTLDTVNAQFFDSGVGIFHFRDDGDVDDAFKITVAGGTGATTLETVSDAADGHLSIVADGHVEFDGCAVGFDKETTTFAASAVLSEGDDSTDIDFRLGNKHELTLTDDIAGSGEYINMFFPATSGNFILVLIQGVADCTINSTGWRAYASDESLCNNEAGQALPDGRVRWGDAGPPTLSTAQYDVDIISIYWDADNQTAFAMASKGF
jgi:hypothetical protein